MVAGMMKYVQHLHPISDDAIENVVGTDDPPSYSARLVARQQSVAQGPVTELY
ncbi:MAG: hypothetical protein K0Q69_714 [Devosia sp.]|nr:hypothetical protein [Devosia sp.]